MTYRDPTGAALARLASLEAQLVTRRAVSIALGRYRLLLRDEMARLEHALAWYRDGERNGWSTPSEVDDLAPALPPHVRVPGTAVLAQLYSGLEADALMRRAGEVEEQLGRARGASGPLWFEIEELRARCASLRADVEAYAWRYPDHPPPPRPRGLRTAGVGLAVSIAGLWMAATLLAFLLG